VTGWNDAETNVIGVGCDKDGNAVRMTTNIKPGLFVLSSNLTILRAVFHLLHYNLVEREQDPIIYDMNNFALHDIMFDAECNANDSRLVTIKTDTSAETMNLFHRFKKDATAYKYAVVSHFWDASRYFLN